MSLKNIILKTGAASIAVSILFSNCSMFGLGLSRVIAENSKAPEVEVNLMSSKYVQYQAEDYSGVALQTKVEVDSIQEEEGYMPTTRAKIEVNLPEINGYLPVRASVAKASTLETTGESKNTNIDQNYDSNSGLLEMSYDNDSYEKYDKDAKDEFEIIYIYPAEAYTGNEEEITLQYEVSTKMTFKTDNTEISSEVSEKFELKETENKGDIQTFNITELKENVYKGFMYSNVENKTSYDTEYKTVSTLCVLNSEISEELTMELSDSKFVLNDEDKTEISTDGKVVYKATGINKAEFDKILGQDGKLEIYNGETLLGTVKYVEVEEDRKIVKKLAVIYSEEDIRVLADDATAAIVEYGENITSLIIKTTTPIAEGFMNFENQNIIKAANDYGAKLGEINHIRTLSSINEYSCNTDIKLSEPKTKISVTSSSINFSTLQTTKTTLTIKLDDTNASTKLFNNPTIKIKLPEGLTGGKLSSPQILNGNGLKIKGSKVENGNEIIITLEGKQTTYDLNNVSGGVSIVMDIENIDFSDATPTHKDEIVLSCIQGEKVVTTRCDVNINSKNGLLIVSKTKGYNSDNTITTNTDSTMKEIEISGNEGAKEVVQTLTLVNNYGEDLSNVQAIGRIGYTNSTFDTKLTKAIEVEEGAKVYYSENKDAGYDDNSWSEDFTQNAKSYKVVLKDNKLEKEKSANIKIHVQLPENLGYNQATYLRTETSYTYNNQTRTDSSTIGMLTEQIQNKLDRLSAETTQLNIDSHVESGEKVLEDKDIVYEGQILKYVLEVQNKTNQTIDNIVLKGTVPEGTTYVKMKKDAYCEEGYFNEDTSVREVSTKPITLEPNKVYTLEYEVRVNGISSNTSSFNQNSYVYINEEEVYSNNIETIVYKAEVQVTTKFLIPDIDPLYGGETAEISLQLKNLTNKKIKGNLDLVFSGYSNIGDIKYITYIYDEGSQQESEREMAPDNIVIDAGETIYYTITIDINNLEDPNANIKDIFKMTAKFTVDDKEYVSNTISKRVLQTGIFLTSSLEGYINNNKVETNSTIKNESEITYKIIVNNIGRLDAERVNIKDYLPDGVVAKNIKYTKYVYSNDGYTTRAVNNELENEKSISIYEDIPSGEALTIYLTCYINGEEGSNISNKADIEIDDGNKIIQTNELGYIIAEEDIEPEDPEEPEEPETPGKPSEPETPDEPTDPEEPNNPETPEVIKYTISGVAWLDTDKDGQKDSEEKLMDSVVVSLVDKNVGNFAIDDSGNKITTTTNSNGEYRFDNIKEGSYLVVFEFDTNTYTVTTYQKENVGETLNSDAIITNITIDGNKKLAGITDNITLNSNKENIDIGLIENATFDLSLDKKIAKVTVVNSQGTQETEYEDGETAKVDLVAKYINTATVIVNYKFTITNNGDTVGYVDSLVDNLPSGLEFSSDLNKDWYEGSDGKLYTNSLSGIAIKPGESTQVELILTKNMTENNTGVFVNTANLEKISNLENVQEKEEAIENNQSSANLFISIKTGSVMLYTGITVMCILVLAAGAYIIKKKILDRGI